MPDGTDRAHSSRQERQRGRAVLCGHFRGSGSRDRLTIITSPSVESAVGRRRDALVQLAPLQCEVREAVMDNRQQVLELADESMDSNVGEYEDNDGLSKVSAEREEENVLGLHVDDTDHLSGWGAQRPIGHEFHDSQRSILTITTGNTQNSSRRISYPGQRTSAVVHISQNRFTSEVPAHLLTVLNLLEMPAITPSQPDQTMPELDSREQQASSRRNMATGLECTILAKARDMIWDWMIFVNPFLDPITLTEEVCTCWSNAQTELGFPDFADATQPSNDQVSYPLSITNLLSQTK